MKTRTNMIVLNDAKISVRKQCDLLRVNRSCPYIQSSYKETGEYSHNGINGS